MVNSPLTTGPWLIRTTFLLAFIIVTCAGCQSATSNFRTAIAPVLTAQEHAALQQVLAEVLQQETVSLAADVFSESSILIMDHPTGKSLALPGGVHMQTPPDKFILLTNGRECVIEQTATKTRRIVPIPCVPIASAAAVSTNVWIPSRNVDIPATLVRPTQTPLAGLPLVLLIHGHGGTRHEAGGFTRVAAGLANNGIASLRMDFPGCGDSREPFQENNLTHMLADIESAFEFAQHHMQVDTTRLGVLGFSMGGRLALHWVANNRQFQVLGLWAPSASPGGNNLKTFLGGPQQYQALRNQAKRDGWATFTTSWGQRQALGLRWFEDLEASFPLDSAARYQGALMVLYGDKDTIVPPTVSESVITHATQASSVTRHVVKDADHGLGLFDHNAALSQQAVQATVDFFSKHL